MIKHDSKDITISQKIFVFFLLVYTKTLSGTTVFKIDKRRMSMLERSLNDHATLKTSEMTTKKIIFAIQGINDIFKYIKIRKLF